MVKLKRSECSVLTLVLKRRWYEMIASGEKREEYRSCGDYWRNRIQRWIDNSFPYGGANALSILSGDMKTTVVAFSLGYRKPDMFFIAEKLLGPSLGCDGPAHPEWGEPDGPHYVICLGDRVEFTD